MTAVEAQPVSLSSGHYKMDDRKRPASFDQDEVAPPSKRQVTATANGPVKSHQDLDLPGKDDLERFQKEAIYRQMQEYKREKISFESQLSDLRKKSAYHDDHLRAIDGWFSQLLDEIKLLAGNLSDGHLYSSFPSSLLSADNAGFGKYLESQSSAIETAIQEIFSKAQNGKPGISELQEQISKLLRSEKQHIDELEKLRLEKEQLEERLETASMRYMMAEKKLDRAKSTTVAKLERQAIAGGKSEAGSGLGGGIDDKQENPNGLVDNQALVEAEAGRKEADAACAKQSEQLQQLAAENQKLTDQVTALRLKASHNSDEDYAHTELFKQAKKQLDDLVNRINNLEAINADLRQEAKRLQSERAAYRTEVDAELHAAITEKDTQLTKAESDLARIRAARDELYSDLQIKKQVQDQDRASVEQIKHMSTAKDERIDNLESEIERLQGINADISNTLDEIPVEELRQKYANLEKQCSMMGQELSTMSSAYKKMSSSASQKNKAVAEIEEKIAKLQAEKVKAEQKYYGAMRAKEAHQQENKTLRAQKSKSSDIISQLTELREAWRQSGSTYEKEKAELMAERAILENKIAALQSAAQKHAAATESLTKNIEGVADAMKTKDAEFAIASSSLRVQETENARLTARLKEQDAQLQKLQQINSGTSSDKVIEGLKELAYCNVCKSDIREMALKQCGHFFCKRCVDERIANRMRKCPTCNKAFSTSDILKITL